MNASMNAGDKIVFAHILRGIAALIVLIGHLCHTFWMLPAISLMLGAPVLDPTPNWFTVLVDRFLAPGALGHFGVSLFFLISGFVIPFSLLNRTRLQFAVARFLRLWPTYAVGLTVTVLIILICANWFGQQTPFAWSTYFYQLLFIRDLFWVQSIDGIVWTLEIEVKFYILMAILAPALRDGRIWPLIAVAAILACITLAASRLPQWIISYDPAYRPLYGVTVSAQMICFMLIGVVFNFLHRGLVSTRAACGLIAFFFIAFAVQWPLGPIKQSSGTGVVTYAVSLAAFAVLYTARSHIRAPAGLTWLADISYPLYVIHGFAGYALMRILFDIGLSVGSCIAIAIAFSLIAAWLLHKFVEVPSQALGKRLSSNLAAMQPIGAREILQ